MARKKAKRRKSRSARALRLLASAVLVFAAFLYYRPLVSYLDRRDSLARRNAEVQALVERKRELERRLAESKSPEALTREARRLGLVKEGERLFIVKGIDAWKRGLGGYDRSR